MSVDHTTISRRVQRYAPELEKRCQLLLKATADSLRVDEAYVKVIPIYGGMPTIREQGRKVKRVHKKIAPPSYIQ